MMRKLKKRIYDNIRNNYLSSSIREKKNVGLFALINNFFNIMKVFSNFLKYKKKWKASTWMVLNFLQVYKEKRSALKLLYIFFKIWNRRTSTLNFLFSFFRIHSGKATTTLFFKNISQNINWERQHLKCLFFFIWFY